MSKRSFIHTKESKILCSFFLLPYWFLFVSPFILCKKYIALIVIGFISIILYIFLIIDIINDNNLPRYFKKNKIYNNQWKFIMIIEIIETISYIIFIGTLLALGFFGDLCDEKKQKKKITNSKKPSDFLTINEKRELKGCSPIDEDNWSFAAPVNYTYDNTKIEVVKYNNTKCQYCGTSNIKNNQCQSCGAFI